MRSKTSPCSHLLPAWVGLIWVAAVACWLSGTEARGQLAITEAMSWASIDCPGCEDSGNVGCRPDFWELTNFGDTAIDLYGYWYVDKEGAFPGAAWRIDRQVIIRPSESIIFLRAGWDLVSNAETFRTWWGTNLSPDVQIICCYPKQGLDEHVDGVRLYDANSNVVDQFFFDVTRRGFTFTYETNCGAAQQSELGVCGAFQAATCTDVGSPGSAPCGPVPLHITQQPISQTVDAGSDVTFSVQACGVPRPRGYQWYFNSTNLPNAAATADTPPTVVNYAGCGLAWKIAPKATDITLLNVQSNHAGQYFVVLTNGLERMTSAVVTLTVNSGSAPPRIECPPPEWCFSSETNLVITQFQTAEFAVVARGYPRPTFRWSLSKDGTNFTNLPNATNDTLVIPYATSGNAGIYRVNVQNSLGAISAYAGLTVMERKPQLKITEAMSDECFTNANDWWELTNVGNEPVNLCGYRWDNHPGNIGGGPTIPNTVIVQPGESVIFLEGLTNEFIAWWGASNLPPGLQFVTYTANGLDFRGDEEIDLWNPTATDPGDWVDQVLLSAATRGASFWFAPDDPCSEFGVVSEEGQCGAFRSAQGCDVGSPGWTERTPPSRTAIRRVGTNVMLEWKAQPGSTNLVEYARELTSTNWSKLGTFTFTGATCAANDPTMGGDSQRFYRVKRVGPTNCPCFFQ